MPSLKQMKPATIILGSALLLVTGGSSAIILKQRAEIDALRARDAAAQAAARTAPLFDPAPEVEPTPAPAAESTTPTTSTGAVRVIPPDAELTQRRSEQGRRGQNRFAELLSDPEIAGLMLTQNRAELDSRYAALFKRLGLNPAETEALKNLLAEKQLSRMETRAVARAEGFAGSDREAIGELLSESDEEVDAKIRALLGADRYSAMKQYEQTAPQRARVERFEQRLSYSDAPLQPFQSDALVGILAESPEPRPQGRLASPEDHAAYIAEVQAYDSEMLSRAQSVLNATQLEALRQMQKERQDRLLLQALMRRRGGGD